jgi:hypothetical protein
MLNLSISDEVKAAISYSQTAMLLVSALMALKISAQDHLEGAVQSEEEVEFAVTIQDLIVAVTIFQMWSMIVRAKPQRITQDSQSLKPTEEDLEADALMETSAHLPRVLKPVCASNLIVLDQDLPPLYN